MLTQASAHFYDPAHRYTHPHTAQAMRLAADMSLVGMAILLTHHTQHTRELN